MAANRSLTEFGPPGAAESCALNPAAVEAAQDGGAITPCTKPGGTACRCGATPHATRPGRCQRGHGLPRNDMGAATRFQPANTANLVHGLRSARVEAAAVSVVVPEDIDRLLADDGAAVRRLLAERLAPATAILTSLEQRLVANATTASGRTSRMLGAYHSQLDRVLRLANLLQTNKATSGPPVDPLDSVRRAVAEASS